MTILDTSVLIDSLSSGGRSSDLLRGTIQQGERLLVPSLVLYEWLRGPRTAAELAVQEALFPTASALPFGTQEAAKSAEIYKRLPRPRGREVDIAIAACALVRDAALWTLNTADFQDVPGLRLAAFPRLID